MCTCQNCPSTTLRVIPVSEGANIPELPEVETIRRGLEKRLVGDAVVSVDVRVPKMFVGDESKIKNSPITNVRRVAKVLIIDFKNGNSLIVHLKMTGQLIYVKHRKNQDDVAVGGHPEKAYEQPLPHKYTHLIYRLKSGATLYYNDLRKFGWHKVILTSDIESALGKVFLGVDILSPDFTLKMFRDLLARRSKQVIKEVIMEQHHLAGLGNIYASEVLWQAKVLPTRRAGSLTNKEQKELYEAIKKVIDLSLQMGGSTFNSYVDATGQKGTFMDHAAVYKKVLDPKGHSVLRIRQGGRTTHYCPICQK